MFPLPDPNRALYPGLLSLSHGSEILYGEGSLYLQYTGLGTKGFDKYMERGRRKLIEGVLANSGLQRLVGSYRKDAQATLGPSSCLSNQSFLGHGNGMPPLSSPRASRLQA